MHKSSIKLELKMIEDVHCKWSAASNYELEHHIIENEFKALWKTSPDSYLINIQYKILHHRVAKNDILLKVGIKTNESSNICNERKRDQYSCLLRV